MPHGERPRGRAARRGAARRGGVAMPYTGAWRSLGAPRAYVGADGSLERGGAAAEHRGRAAEAAALCGGGTGLGGLDALAPQDFTGAGAMASIRNADLAARDAARDGARDAGALHARDTAAAAYEAALGEGTASLRQLAAAQTGAARASARPAPFIKPPADPNTLPPDAAALARRAAGISQLAVVQAAAEAAASWEAASAAKAAPKKPAKKPKRTKGVAHPSPAPRHMTLADLESSGDHVLVSSAVAEGVQRALELLAAGGVAGGEYGAHNLENEARVAPPAAAVKAARAAAAARSAAAVAAERADASWGDSVLAAALGTARDELVQIKGKAKDEVLGGKETDEAMDGGGKDARVAAGEAAAAPSADAVVVSEGAMRTAWEAARGFSRDEEAAVGSAGGTAAAGKVVGGG